MKKIIGASIAIVIGVVGLSVFFSAFADLLAGIIPLFLLLGGALAIYIHIESKRCEITENEDTTGSSYTKPVGPAAVPSPPAETVKTEPVKPPEQAETPTDDQTEEKPTPAPDEKISPAKSAPAQPEPEKAEDSGTDKQGRYIGNTESRVFHSTDCKFSNSKNCTAVFVTREDAVKEGYKPCATCTP